MPKFKIKPSQKENWRYIAFQLEPVISIKEQEVTWILMKSILQLHGELGAASANAWPIQYDTETQKGILRCSHDRLEEVLAAISLITKINEKPAVVRALSVSGTLKTLRARHVMKKPVKE